VAALPAGLKGSGRQLQSYGALTRSARFRRLGFPKKEKMLALAAGRRSMAFAGRTPLCVTASALAGLGMTLIADTNKQQAMTGPLLMLWTAPPPARECHECGCR
jgi:hypothetical protein